MRKGDVSIAKNYLNADELRALNNLVEQYLVFAQSQAERRLPMNMQDWITKLEGFLILNDRGVLKNAGKSPPFSPKSMPKKNSQPIAARKIDCSNPTSTKP
jgi:hypothetical protein